MAKFSQIVFSATVAAAAAGGGRLDIKASDGNTCFIENEGGSALQSSCDIIMPSTNSIKDELSALRDDICAIRLTHGIDGHNLDMASIVNLNSGSATMKSSSDGKCKYHCANGHQAEDSGANQCQPCRTAGAGSFTSTVCSTISNTAITTCGIAGVGERQTAPCAPGSASTVGSNTIISTCTTKPDFSSYTTAGSCAWACDAAYKSFDGATCVLTTAPTAYPTAYPTANPTASPTCATFTFQIESNEWDTSYRNWWDSAHDDKCASNQALTGLSSYHSDRKEDRRMKFRCGTLGQGITTETDSITDEVVMTGAVGGETGYDEEWTRECPSDSYMTGFSSHHHNHNEDRRFTFKCIKFTNQGLSRTQDAEFSVWQNEWDANLDYSSGTNKFITAIHSMHDNVKEDRRFQFKTSTFSGREC
jgi:hypothetical protein